MKTMIVSTDMDLARDLAATVDGPKVLLLRAEEEGVGGELRQRAEAAQKWFRRQIYINQPDVILLDSQHGGNLYRAIASIPRIIQTRSKPKVILIVPFESEDIEDAALAFGCSSVICRLASDFSERVSSSVAWARRSPLAIFPEVPDRAAMH